MARTAPDSVSRVAIVGTGTIGASWCTYFLARGMAVAAYDPMAGAEARTRGFVERAWRDLEALGLVRDGAGPDALSFAASLEDAVAEAEFIQENGPEDQAKKGALFAAIDAACPPETIIASSTSALVMSPIQAHCARPERCVNAHPFNPPHLMPLVEVSGGDRTEDEAIAWTMKFYTAIGRVPVRLNREVYGHIANRLQYALYNEAVRIVLDGIANVADVDAAVRNGPGLRWGIQGPFLNYHLAGGEGGLERFYEIFEGRDKGNTDRVARQTLTDEQKRILADGIAEMLAGDDAFAELTARRDRRLVELLRLRARMEAGEL
ncbi:MAG: 3-hydroxyacyl-CoA dehydrogenase [Rhodospirillaceae bacterium]|jgi:carnitine 3-dehydrogenase|nr:3-hydroxyacyl-CoA dehydrogenase [Rhodospirillaceae bacterium]MBT6116441.1 3-hydroxyacyl-CoA dehydrogenase [Rhodospirillaceae bacterium]